MLLRYRNICDLFFTRSLLYGTFSLPRSPGVDAVLLVIDACHDLFLSPLFPPFHDFPAPFLHPVDVVKSRMQTDVVGGGPGMFEIASTLYNDGGYRPFFQGLTATLWRAIVNHAATFVVYEAAMGFLMKGGGSGGGTDEEDRENESE